jgi:hypothetical protein
MKTGFPDEIVAEGVHALYERLGVAGTVKFFQLIGGTAGDLLTELEGKTERMTEAEVLSLVAKAKKERPEVWKRVGFI